jgi:preprotein translocase subunit YajC
MGYNAGNSFFKGTDMLYSLILFAEGGGDGGMWLFYTIPVVLLIMWFLMVSPQKKQEERLKNMLNSLEKNDKVMTVGGLIGTVHTVDKEQNEIVLKVDDANNTRIRFHLTAISTVFPKEVSEKK